VKQAVDTELNASRSDHSHWLYFEVDRKPKTNLTQWVAQTSKGDLHRVLEENSHKDSEQEQRQKMDSFVRDAGAQAQQRKGSKHDDDEATELLKLLPKAFVWMVTGRESGVTSLHFKPDPNLTLRIARLRYLPRWRER